MLTIARVAHNTDVLRALLRRSRCTLCHEGDLRRRSAPRIAREGEVQQAARDVSLDDVRVVRLRRSTLRRVTPQADHLSLHCDARAPLRRSFRVALCRIHAVVVRLREARRGELRFALREDALIRRRSVRLHRTPGRQPGSRSARNQVPVARTRRRELVGVCADVDDALARPRRTLRVDLSDPSPRRRVPPHTVVARD